MRSAPIELAIILSCLIATPAAAEQVRHLFANGTSLLSLETQGACQALTVHADALRCNPATIRHSAKNAAVMEATAKLDEKSYRATWNFLTEKMTQDALRNLFLERDFMSFSGYARLETRSPWVALEYSPLALFGAYRLSNPSLPRLQAAASQMSEARLTTALNTDDILHDFPLDISLGATLRYLTIKHHTIDVDTIEAITEDRDSYVDKEKDRRFDANLGAFLRSWVRWLPNVGVTIENLNGPRREDDHPDTVQIGAPFAPQASASLAWELNLPVGMCWAGVAAFWQGLFEAQEWQRNSITAGYRVGELVASAGYSPARHGWGIILHRGYYHLGLHYANEKQPAYFPVERVEHVYVSFGAAL